MDPAAVPPPPGGAGNYRSDTLGNEGVESVSRQDAESETGLIY